MLHDEMRVIIVIYDYFCVSSKDRGLKVVKFQNW